MSYDGHVFMDIWRGIKSLFHRSAPDTTTAAALDTGIAALDAITEAWDETYKAPVEAILSDNADASIDQVEKVIKETSAAFKGFKDIADLPGLLKNTQFSADPKTDVFYHNLLMQGATFWKDEKIDGAELLLLTLTIVGYIKK
jgi:hypothetical protein